MYNSRRGESNYLVVKVSSDLCNRFFINHFCWKIILQKMWSCVYEQMQLSRPSALWCLNWSIITNVPWLMASFANLHLSNIQRVRIEKNRILFWIPYIDYFCIINTIHLEMRKKFLPISLLYCLDILTSIEHNPVTCVSLRWLPYLPCSCLLGISLWLVLKKKE